MGKLREENEKLQEENARLKQKLKALDLELKKRKSSTDNGTGDSLARTTSANPTTDDERMEIDNEKSSSTKPSKDAASDSSSEPANGEIKRNASNMEEAGTINLKKERIDVGKE